MIRMDATNFYPTLPYASKKLLVLFVKTKNCEPCAKMEPIVKKVSEDFAGHIIVGVMDKTECGEIVSGLGLDLFPSFVLFRKEKMIAKHTGRCSETFLKTFITRYEAAAMEMENYNG